MVTSISLPNIMVIGKFWFIYSLRRLQLQPRTVSGTHVRPQCLPDCQKIVPVPLIRLYGSDTV